MSVEPAGRVVGDLARSLHAATEVAASRERVRRGLLGRERAVTLLLAGGFALAALACAAWLPSERPLSLATAALLTVLYAVLAQVEFEVGPGSAIPTELVLVPMLFLLPPGAVPVCVAGGLVASGVVERLRGHRHGDRMAVLLSSAWHSVGPALVIGLLAPGAPSWDAAHVYVLALLAQFVFDAGAATTRHSLGRGAPVVDLLSALGWVALVDALLAPVALAVAVAGAATSSAAVLCVVPLAALLFMLGAERRRRIDESLAFGRAVEDAAREARSDPLTKLGNRLAWQEAVADADGRSGDVAVLLADLDRLKETNDTYGHDVGDRLIQAMGEALRQVLGGAHVVARIGGDEFAILVDATDEELSALVDAVRTELRAVRVGELSISASIGAALCASGESLPDAIALADARLYENKLLSGP